MPELGCSVVGLGIGVGYDVPDAVVLHQTTMTDAVEVVVGSGKEFASTFSHVTSAAVKIRSFDFLAATYNGLVVATLPFAAIVP